MNTKQFSKKILKNWREKIICFVLALAIYIFHQFSIVDKKTFSIPLQIKEDGSMVTAMVRDQNVRITIRGKSEELASVLDSELTAYLDISELTKEGTYELPVLVKTTSRISVMDPFEVNVSPDKIKISVEERVQKYVPVKPLYAGECAYGFEIPEIKIEPDVILIQGPKQMVESITGIGTEKITLSGLSKNAEFTVKPFSLNKLITVDDVSDIKVSVKVRESMSERQFDNLAVNFINKADNVKFNFPVTKVSLIVTGTLLNVRALKDRQITVQADCSSVKSTGDFEIPVRVRLPKGFSYEGLSNERIPVSAELIVIEEPPAETEAEQIEGLEVNAENKENDGVKTDAASENKSEENKKNENTVNAPEVPAKNKS